VESEPYAGDFEPVTCGYGSVYRFFGNGCEHLTELNVSGATRLSLDFRVIRGQEVCVFVCVYIFVYTYIYTYIYIYMYIYIYI